MKTDRDPPPAVERRDSGPGSEVPDPREVTDLLADWFSGAARELPWRRHRTGYHGLVSEAMLQQTQVDRVVPAYERFLDRFPTVASLAEAPPEDVMASWQGLGYYRRARNLQAAAVAILERFDGEVPESVEELRSLPGVGRYTAGAISSIVFGHRAPIVDGNVSRVLARLCNHDGRPGERSFDAWAWAREEELVGSAEDPAASNEAMMELGALVCTRHAPTCNTCPLSALCAARRAGSPEEIPPPRKVGPRKTVHHHSVLIEHEGAVLLLRRPDRGLWGGMWEPPTVESPECLPPSRVVGRLPVGVEAQRPIGSFEHRTTHRDVIFHVHRAEYARAPGDREHIWLRLDALDSVGLSNPHRRAIGLLDVESRPEAD